MTEKMYWKIMKTNSSYFEQQYALFDVKRELISILLSYTCLISNWNTPRRLYHRNWTWVRYNVATITEEHA